MGGGATIVAIVLAATLTAQAPRADDSADAYEPVAIEFARPGPGAPLVNTASTKHLLLDRGDGYSGLVLSVFKMRLEDLLPADASRSRARFRPYLLGGTADVKIRRDNRYGHDILGEGRSTALHLGGGTEVRVSDSLSLSFDFGEVVGTSSEGSFDDQSYQLGLNYRF